MLILLLPLGFLFFIQDSKDITGSLSGFPFLVPLSIAHGRIR